MASQTVVYTHGVDDEKIRALEDDPNVIIREKHTETYDTVHLLPLHLEPHHTYLRYRTTYVYDIVKLKRESPRQDATSAVKAGQGPKTRGDTNEFISAFWVNGKPKCRIGYRYDFSRKMCRLIK